MTNETISLNEDFKDLLLCVEGNDVKRKELINMAASKFELSTKQAEGFVARNIHKLQQVHILADHEHPFWSMVNTDSGAS